ncbi:hypothetical protein HYFRA_00005209 [Hymenoscyphus fraxineus]|uniref:RING-type domain-containing protein n=1 Tax=Hymenoscyphus fraxineus TaxID=746836 RepID=A0A9N9LDB3_9HELO|nr:hypothetical protein HYFRA_00005209 [Hymenoscyphus fraxineus]
MDSDMENRGLVDLEKELTCSICTEVLYQPLTLLDCLHTFCGACLKEWFRWQLTNSRNAQTPLAPGTTPYTCPSCRDPVRNTRHDSRVTTLLEMFLAANPSKGRTSEEKEELAKKYKVGDEILPKVETREKSLRERRAEDEDRRLVDEVRNLSLREVGVAGEGTGERRERRRREETRLRPSQPSSSREQSRDGRSSDDRERHRRREAEAARRRTRDSTLRTDSNSDSGPESRRRRSDAESRRRHEETHRTAARQIEHQSSLRSLISSSDVDSRDMEEEILRQIREEGLLDGIDLENIDVSQEDQISERIAEAFRRRQAEKAEKARRERERRRSADQRRQARISEPGSREVSGDDRSSRRRIHSRNTSAVSQADERSRPPPSMSQAHAAQLGVHSQDERHHRRRNTSGSRSSTAPLPIADTIARPATRSSTDLSSRPRSLDMSITRPHVTTNSRSSTDPASQRPRGVSTSSRERQHGSNSSPRLETTSRIEDSAVQPTGPTSSIRRSPPADISTPSSSLAVSSSPIEQSLVPAPLTPNHSPGPSPNHSPRTSLSDRAIALSSGTRPTSSSSASQGYRTRAPFYPEPSITCARCSRPHIEYDLHYNCGICYGGNYNVCLRCFRTANFEGCLHWFGFGYAAWTNWEALIRSGDLPASAEKPHGLIASRYIPPKTTPGGAEGRKTLTNEDPLKRLQSGVFCANCLAWTNQCYWRCDFCNEGDWGFCNTCVNQGKCCTHPLLPLTYKSPETSDITPMSPIQIPASASILTGPDVMNIGHFKPLTFSTACDICRSSIAPTTTRFHCLSCTSSKLPNRQSGDYDICSNCYTRLVANRRISMENGPKGWRRCLEGHRMIIIGFESKHGGQRRVITSDLIGGWLLHTETFPSTDFPDLQKWSWGDKHQKLVTNNVMNTSPPSIPNFEQDSGFPAEGGDGIRCVARWSWYPEEGADDELAFPKGAEIRECKDINGEWWHGTYMGKRGLFPSVYGRVVGGPK